MAETLTRKDQVLEVLRTGGHVQADVREVGFGICHLYDATGQIVPAWQQAITANLKGSACVVSRVGKFNEWRLRR